ncbi:glycosyltransferase family 2 protein [Clostridium perfringens]|uniref:glycosyltransferase family 2 protein n=1 Tax=Clostridium perfringens TaxID=1502 RepID=UPI0018E4C756|nr:glycosyltransferase family A protein [Clostridium perfringens]MBI6019092.1 glycosyltransferase family 2 protein [Clostridium perfringens]
MTSINEEPMVSIVIPVFNGESYIENIINCMLRQTYTNWELIFVDDKSEDDTKNIISRFSECDNRIKLIVRNREPKGSTTCRNIGLEAVSGKYLINIDADDFISDDFLQDRVRFMEENLECDYATFKACSVRKVKDKLYFDGEVWGKSRNDDILELFLSTKYPFSIWNNIYRTKKFKNEKWDENVKIYTDFSYAVPAILKGYKHKFALKDAWDYFYVVGVQNSMCSNFISQEKYESTKYLFGKIWRNINEIDDNKKYKKAFNKFFELQFTRLLIKGTEWQQKDYLKFCEEYLNRYALLKMNLVFKGIKLSNNIFKDNNYLSKIIIALFYYPKNIWYGVKNRLNLNTESDLVEVLKIERY